MRKHNGRPAEADGEDWVDYQLSLETKVLSTGGDWRDGVWVGVRCRGWNQYCVQFYGGRVVLYKNWIGQSITGSSPIAHALAARSGFVDGEWHRITVTARGSKIRIDIDAATVLEFSDIDTGDLLGPIPCGGIMLGARRWSRSPGDTTALFRNIQVSALPGAGAPPARFGLEGMIRPWEKRETRPTFEEVLAGLRGAANRHPERADLERFGRSLEGDPIVALRITDKSVSDADKHSIVITALDSGWERGGTGGAVRTIDWLLGDEPLAVESLRNHVVGVMPIPNPYGYRASRATNSKGINTYHGGRARSDQWDLESLTVKNPEDAPHLVALTKLFDRFRPEFHFDLHGVDLKYGGQLVQPSLGSAYSNTANRPWDWRLLEAMMRYANREGYGYTRMEVDAQQLLYGDQMQPLTKRFWMGRPFFYSAHYAYAKYHTMPCTSEVAWPDGAVAAVKGLLDFGNRQSASAPVPGYPVNHVRTFINYRVCAYGSTTSARRESRVALWQRQEELGLGFLYNYNRRSRHACLHVGQTGLRQAAWSEQAGRPFGCTRLSPELGAVSPGGCASRTSIRALRTAIEPCLRRALRGQDILPPGRRPGFGDTGLLPAIRNSSPEVERQGFDREPRRRLSVLVLSRGRLLDCPGEHSRDPYRSRPNFDRDPCVLARARTHLQLESGGTRVEDCYPFTGE